MGSFWSAVITFLLSQGVFGLVCLLQLVAIYFLWKKLTDKDDKITELEKQARDQAKECTERALEIQERVFNSQTQFNQVVDKLILALESKGRK